MANQITTLNQAISELKERYSFISEFELEINHNNKIVGGFYKMNYNGRKDGEYFFHETFYTPSENDTVDSIVLSISKRINKQLIWQKETDENFAKEYDRDVVYKYNYSLIPST